MSLVQPIVQPKPAPAVQVGGTLEVAMQQRKTMLLDKIINSKKVEAGETPPIIILEGNKNSKTISACAVPLTKGRSADGRCEIFETPGLPVPPGLVSVITFDHQTELSLANHYGKTQEGINAMEVINLRRILGYRAGVPSTAVDVVEGLQALLESWKNDKRSMIVMDRTDMFTEEVTKGFCYAKSKIGAFAAGKDVARDTWNPRRPIIGDLIDLLQGAVKPNGAIILTGEEDKGEGDERLAKVGDEWKMAVVPSKWANRFTGHVTARLTSMCAIDNGSPVTAQKHRFASCDYSRYKPLPEGIQARTNGRHIGVFQDPSSFVQSKVKEN